MGVYDSGKWIEIATHLQGKNAKQCRAQWVDQLRPHMSKSAWTTEEDQEIWDRVLQVGRKWVQISKLYMPSRADNDIKNRWNSIIRKPRAPGGRAWNAAEIEM